eukprot:TRINITY_DN12049_c0_g1_i2.p1 TRINITY_DN12049_c0_g1~~TRINITY_DN12049_c0_g1_i2.p1  ORF type:complete len:604 (+),score=71.65 TRINITY_DN12049_c0_g1_i2:57-1868(+)
MVPSPSFVAVGARESRPIDEARGIVSCDDAEVAVEDVFGAFPAESLSAPTKDHESQLIGSARELRVAEHYLQRFETVLVTNVAALTEAIASLRFPSHPEQPDTNGAVAFNSEIYRKENTTSEPRAQSPRLMFPVARPRSTWLDDVRSSLWRSSFSGKRSSNAGKCMRVSSPLSLIATSGIRPTRSEKLSAIMKSALATDILKYVPSGARSVTRGRIALIADTIRNSLCFRMLVIATLLVSTVSLGMQVNHLAANGTDKPSLQSVETTCMVIFTMELIPRAVFVVRWDTFGGGMVDRLFVFDAMIVFLAWIDFAMSLLLADGKDVDTNVATILTVARSARSLRLCRLVCFLPQVRVVVLTIINSLGDLFWLWILMMCVIFVFAVTITDGVARFSHFGDAHVDLAEDLKEDFGSVGRGMYTLLKCIIGGVSWGEPAGRISQIGGGYFAVFMLFIALMMFSILNVVLGFFVDGAIQLMERDRELCQERALEKNKRIANDLVTLLAHLDEDGDGCITFSEWLDALADEQTRVLLDALGFDAADGESIFESIDVDHNGSISLRELVNGVQRIKGKATALHMDLLMRRTSRVDEMFAVLQRVHAKLQEI